MLVFRVGLETMGIPFARFANRVCPCLGPQFSCVGLMVSNTSISTSWHSFWKPALAFSVVQWYYHKHYTLYIMDPFGIEVGKLNVFDGIFLKRAQFVNRVFPAHIHHEWSLALIESGSEWLSIFGRYMQLPANTLVLIPPYVPHANHGNANAPWTYRSMYVHPDAMVHLLHANGADPQRFSAMPYWVSREAALVKQFKRISDSTAIESAVEADVARLFTYIIKHWKATQEEHAELLRHSSVFSEVLSHLHLHFQEKLTLECLASTFRFNRYKLLRLFTCDVGLTPQEYITSLRIEYAKTMLITPCSISEVAFASGFYDQSHFTHTFRKYVGVSPGAYRNSCNILQDNSFGRQ